MPEYAKTKKDAATKLGITYRAFNKLEKVEGFPAATKQGYNVGKLRQWAEKNGRAQFRKNNLGKESTNGNGRHSGLSEANFRKVDAQARNETLKGDREAIEFAKLLGEILSIEDVRSMMKQMIATAKSVMDSHFTAIDRTLPEKYPTEAAWPGLRAKVMALAGKLEADVAAAMNNQWQ